MHILECVDNLIQEISQKKIVRKGKVIVLRGKRANRPTGPGWKWDVISNNWKRQTGQDKQMLRNAVIKRSRTLKMGESARNRVALKSRIKSNRVRKSRVR